MNQITHTQNIVVCGGQRMSQADSGVLDKGVPVKKTPLHETVQHIQFALSLLLPIVRGIDDPVVKEHQKTLEMIESILGKSGG